MQLVCSYNSLFNQAPSTFHEAWTKKLRSSLKFLAGEPLSVPDTVLAVSTFGPFLTAERLKNPPCETDMQNKMKEHANDRYWLLNSNSILKS